MMAFHKAKLLLCLLSASHHVRAFYPQKPNGNSVRHRMTSGFAASSAPSTEPIDTNVNLAATAKIINTRRDLLVQTRGAILASLILATTTATISSSALADDTATSRTKTIVVTGSNSGVGFEACKRLAAAGHTLVLACRTEAKAQAAVDRIREQVFESQESKGGILIPAECDLADLQSIRTLAENIPDLIDGKRIDTLCLNAGLSRNTASTDCARTKDGYELTGECRSIEYARLRVTSFLLHSFLRALPLTSTVGTNHFGHFYLNHLLLPNMAKDGQIVVTASSVHDPESPGGAQGEKATLGNLRGLEEQGRDCEMVDGNSFNADKAYKDSKLCNVLFTRELQRRLERSDATKGMSVNCFSPGLIVGTGLFRDQNPVFVKVRLWQ
jgi:protochlorophyllide reductase